MTAKIRAFGHEFTVKVSRYATTGRRSVSLYDEHDSHFMTATVNLTDEQYVHNQLKYNEIVAKDYSENVIVYDALVNAKVFIPTGQYVKTDFRTVPVCLLNIDDDGNFIDQEGVPNENL